MADVRYPRLPVAARGAGPCGGACLPLEALAGAAAGPPEAPWGAGPPRPGPRGGKVNETSYPRSCDLYGTWVRCCYNERRYVITGNGGGGMDDWRWCWALLARLFLLGIVAVAVTGLFALMMERIGG